MNAQTSPIERKDCTFESREWVAKGSSIRLRAKFANERTDRMAGSPQPVILVIADISGYTRFMVANAKALVHAQAIITELLEAILHQVELPLRVAKLEGDAVFMYAIRAAESDSAWNEAKGPHPSTA